MKLYLTAKPKDDGWVLVFPDGDETGDDLFPTAQDALEAASWYLCVECMYHEIIDNEIYLM